MSKWQKEAKYDHETSPEFVGPVQHLMNLINNRDDAGVKRPAMMPAHPQDAANWWMTKQEPPHDDEDPKLYWTQRKSATDVSKQYWKEPYSDRLVETLKRFYKLSHADQMYILDLHEQGIWWRGDSIEFMKIRETVDANNIDKQTLRQQLRNAIGSSHA